MKPVPAHVPAVGAPRQMRTPAAESATLRNGLKVVAVRKPSVPKVEVRLRLPAGGVHDRGDGARAQVLPEALLGGTGSRSSLEIAAALQGFGASLGIESRSDSAIAAGATLSRNLPGFLDLVAEVLVGASYPGDEVAVARERAAQEIAIAMSNPATVLSIADRKRIFGSHRYGRGFPSPAAVQRLGAGPLRTFHAAMIKPRGSTLVLAGDLNPAKAIEAVERAFAPWKGKPQSPEPGAPPSTPKGLPLRIIDRPGSLQTNMVISGPALPRSHPEYLPLMLASTILGGYFSSRLFANVREEKGYTYGISARVEHRRGISTFHVRTACATEVTVPALHEIRYELGRMIAMDVEEAELNAARRFVTGITMIAIQRQSGFASHLDDLVADGLGLDYLRSLPVALEQVTTADVRAAAERFFSPRLHTTTFVGDASAFARSLEAFDQVEVKPEP